MTSLRRHPGRYLASILFAYLLLAFGYGAVNPLFEAPDEHWHYFTAQTITETGSLPKVSAEADPWLGQEAAQPPLYYALSALLISPFDIGQARELVRPNPRVQLGDASSPTNINAFIHTPAEQFPWQGHVLAAHLLRLFSTLLGLGTLVCIYGAGRLFWPDEPERTLLAVALVAFLPQYAFLHSAISNDPLIIFLCTFTLWQLLRLWTGQVRWSAIFLLGVTVGLAILSKTAGLLLLLYAAISLAALAWRDKNAEHSRAELRLRLLQLLLFLFLALAISGWLLWRNWQLYGDITATSAFIRLAGGDRHYALLEVLAESSGLWTSLFAVFGWFNVRAPQWVTIIWNGLVLAAILGVILYVARKKVPEGYRLRDGEMQPAILVQRSWFPALLLGLWVFMVYAGLLSFMLRTPAAQGRLLFPALLPLGLALSYGLSRGFGRISWPGIYAIAPFLALLTSLYCLFVVIPRTYAGPPVIDVLAIPEEAARLDADMGQGLTLVAAEVETGSAYPGDWLRLTLYWQAMTIPGNRLSPEFVIELLGQGDMLVGKLQSYHGGGLFPVELWPAGEIVADRMAVRLEEQLTLPVQVRLNAKLVGQEKAVDVGTVKIRPREWPAFIEQVAARLNGIELVSAGLSKATARPGDAVQIEVFWQVKTAPQRTLTTFVHLGDPSKEPLVQGDSPPRAGNYPTTLWEPGEVFTDTYTLVLPPDLPPGRYPISIGLYDPTSGNRLPLSVEGVNQPNNAYLVDRLTVEPR